VAVLGAGQVAQADEPEDMRLDLRLRDLLAYANVRPHAPFAGETGQLLDRALESSRQLDRHRLEAGTIAGDEKIVKGCFYGSSRPAVDFPRYAELHLAGRLPVERLIDRRIALDDVEGAFDRLRAGVGLRQVVVFD